MSFCKKSSKVKPIVEDNVQTSKETTNLEVFKEPISIKSSVKTAKVAIDPNEKTDSNKYPLYNQMDDANKKAMDVWEKDGMEAAVKHMFTDQKTGRPLTYAEMRSLYG